MNTGAARAGEGASGSRATNGTVAVSLGSEEADTGAGAKAGGGTDAAVSSGGTRAGEGAPGSRATGATAAVSLRLRGSRYWQPEPRRAAGQMLP